MLVEVRGRRLGAAPDPALSLFRRKRLRFLRAALLYAAAHGEPEPRLDVVLVGWGAGVCVVRHLRDVGDELLAGGEIG